MPSLFIPATAQPLATVTVLLSPRFLRFPNATQLDSYSIVAFAEWLLSLRNMHVRVLRVFSWLDISFLFSAEPYSMVWMDPAIYPSATVEHLDCFQILVIMNKAAINICLCVDINIHLF